MTTILDKRYGLTTEGIFKYAVNRFLRIYPTYFVVFLLTVLSLYLLGSDNISRLDVNLGVPDGINSWLKNLTLIGMDFNTNIRTVPPAWTLFIEVCFYIIIPAVMLLGRRGIWLWFLLSVACHVVIIFHSTYPYYDWNARYGTVLAGSLGFSIGCLMSTYQDRINISSFIGFSSLTGIVALHILVLYLFDLGLSHTDEFYMSTVLYYINMALSALIVVFLFKIKESSLSRGIGEYSYPLYLVHIPVAFVVYKTTGFAVKSNALFFSSIALALCACFILVKMESKINKARNKIKNL